MITSLDLTESTCRSTASRANSGSAWAMGLNVIVVLAAIVRLVKSGVTSMARFTTAMARSGAYLRYSGESGGAKNELALRHSASRAVSARRATATPLSVTTASRREENLTAIVLPENGASVSVDFMVVSFN